MAHGIITISGTIKALIMNSLLKYAGYSYTCKMNSQGYFIHIPNQPWVFNVKAYLYDSMITSYEPYGGTIYE